jgi:RNA polymerase sigma factor for flagellar operon FliA
MARTEGRKRVADGDLWVRYRGTRRRELRDRLIELYLPVVRSEARRLVKRLPPHIESDDLVSAGTLGLVRAIEHFDPARGVRFESYCRKRVVGAMIDELRKQDWIPREARDRAELLRRTVQALRDELRREPSDQEVAQAMGTPVRTVRAIRRDLQTASWIPLHDTTRDDFGDDGGRVLRFEPIDGFPLPPDVVCQDELMGMVDDQLSRRERAIVRSYYHDEQTMKRIGHRLRLSESRVSQMHHRMLLRLKERLYREAAP